MSFALFFVQLFYFALSVEEIDGDSKPKEWKIDWGSTHEACHEKYPTRKDENARLLVTCMHDGPWTCLPKKYIEEDWECDFFGWPGKDKCALLGIPPCLQKEDYEEAASKPCDPTSYASRLDPKWAKTACSDFTVEGLKNDVKELSKRIDELKEDLFHCSDPLLWRCFKILEERRK
jgi:hypothetical protein